MICVILLLTPLYLRSGAAARSALESAEHFESSEDVRRQIEYLGKSASWRSPFNRDAHKALSELRALSQSPNLSNEQLLLMLQAERRALMKTRSWLDLLSGDDVAARIQQINARESRLRNVDGIQPVTERHPATIRSGPQLLAQGFFLLWITSVVLAIFRGIRMDGSIDSGPLLRHGGTAAASYILWLSTLLYV